MAAQSSRAGAAVDRTALDPQADACTDFYQFACGGWVAGNAVTADRQRWGRFAEVLDRNFTILRRILEEPAPRVGQESAQSAIEGARGGGDLRKARDYYAACMDESAITAAHAAPIASELAEISALERRDALPELVAHLQAIVGETPPSGSTRRAGYYVFFRLGSRPRFEDATMEEAAVAPDGIALPSRDYYLKTDDRSKALRDEYRRHIARMLTLSGIAPGEAATGASAVLAIEAAMAKGMLDVADRRDPQAVKHPMTVGELQALTPAFNWPRYLTASRAPAFTTLNVNEPEFMRAVNTVIRTTSLPDLKMYLRWHAVHGAAARLPAAFSAATFDFFNRRLTGQEQPPPRWRECLSDTDQQLGEALGKAFVEEAFSVQAKTDMLKMVQDIKGTMKRDIEEAPWMSKETKGAAQIKLAAVIDRIGYPETWRDYGAVRISRTDALGNLQRALAFHNARRLAKIGQSVDRNEWSMTPPTVNAYYSSSSNIK